MTAHSLTN